MEPRPGEALARLLSPRAAVGLALAAVVALSTLGRAGRAPMGQAPAGAEDAGSALTEVAYALPAPRSATASVGGTSAGRPMALVARTWTNVRNARRRSAELEAVLTPGDTVLADSLAEGWYRVALYGEVLGYAHRATLVPLGAPADSLP